MTAEDYLRRVAFELRDLPWGMRRELASELRGHLAELPPDTDLAGRLGAPEEYAADLRSAAGLERRRGTGAFLRARRPRNMILAAVVVAVLGLAIGAVAWIQSYKPIAFAGSTQFPAGARPASGSEGESVVFRKGRPFEFGITVQNTGRFTVRVVGVPSMFPLPFSARLLMSGPQKEPGVEAPFKRFQPFDMKPGEIRWLLLKGVYACQTGMGRETGIGLVALPVRFRFLWRTTTTLIPLQDQLAFTFPNGCPSSSRFTP